MFAQALHWIRYSRLITVFFLFQAFGSYAIQASVPDERIVSTDTIDNYDVLILSKYSSDKQKKVAQGTVIKVFLTPLKAEQEISSKASIFSSGKETYRGQFQTIVGDVLTMTQKGKLLKFDIDEIYRIKVYNTVQARFFGNLMNLTGLTGIGIGGIFLGVTVQMVLEGSIWAGILLPGASIFLTAGFLLHRWALAINRRKYNLNKWYIQPTRVPINKKVLSVANNQSIIQYP